MPWRTLVVLAGWDQLVLAAASLAIPRVLGWREDLAKLRPLTCKVFWTYAVHIWGAHVGFGLLSILGPDLLLDRSALARAVCSFIAVWWTARLAVQFAWFGRAAPPRSRFLGVAEAALVALFAANAPLYGAVALRDLTR
jgi:hypothetical protein